MQVITQLDMESLHAFEWLAVDITIIQQMLAYALVGELTVAFFIASSTIFTILYLHCINAVHTDSEIVRGLYQLLTEYIMKYKL